MARRQPARYATTRRYRRLLTSLRARRLCRTWIHACQRGKGWLLTNWPRNIDRALYDQLCTLDFIDKKQNLLRRGPSGVGKTTLAKNLGILALNSGYAVRFTTLAAALADLLKQEALPALDRRIKRYTAPALWICGEIGYLPCDSRCADLLYNIISRRHENAATIITTNIPFKK